MAPDPPAFRDRRILVSQFLVTALLGTALQEAIDPVRSAIRSEGVTPHSYTLFIVFFLTLFRFFVGDILHLQSDDLTGLSGGFRWIFDLFFITVHCVIFAFMAGEASLSESRDARFGFFDLLFLLYLVDIGWLGLVLGAHKAAALSFLSRARSSLVRQHIPYGWVALNMLLAIHLVAFGFLNENEDFGNVDLLALAGLNVAALVLDIAVFNYHDIF
jgi:hypothetical protein